MVLAQRLDFGTKRQTRRGIKFNCKLTRMLILFKQNKQTFRIILIIVRVNSYQFVVSKNKTPHLSAAENQKDILTAYKKAKQIPP